MEWSARSIELVWAASLAAIPVALLAAVCSHWKFVRPATRHALWFAVLATLLSPAIIGLWRPAWFRSERVLAAADTAVGTVIRSAKTAKSAYLALAPFQSDLGAVSTPDDLPDCPSAGVLPTAAPTFRHAPAADDRSPTRRNDTQAVHTNVQARRSESPGSPLIYPKDVGPIQVSVRDIASPIERSTLTDEELGLAPKKAEHERKASTADVASTSAPSPAAPPTAPPGQFRTWLTRVLAVRDAVAAVPAIPPLVWLSGAGFIVLLWAIRIARVRRMLGRAQPAPAPMVTLVRRLAKVAGLKRIPETLVVDDRISPMIWCGLRPRLVIPRGLWSELDTRCQCAVIVHELSHLRRRDHRLCLIESIIGLIYWWHPIAWWARSRLREEAEACCDAWVTTLLPGGRRAYAEALVTTKSFLSVPGRSGAPGLSVVSGRTRQLARRISMVMTQRVAPRASLMGLAFALSVGAAGMFVMPGLACPPEDEKSGSQAKVVAKERAVKEKALQAELKAKARKDKAPQAFYGEAPALEAMRQRERQPEPPRGGGDGQMGALQDMERSLQQMEQRLKEMQKRLESMQKGNSPRSQAPMTAPRAVAGLRGAAVGPQVTTTLTPMPRTTVNVAPRLAQIDVVDNGQVEPRAYSLPKGKLDALVSLMARDDVPIFISSDGNTITINATPGQHRVFKLFVDMIHPGAQGNAGQANEFRALTEVQAAQGQRALALRELAATQGRANADHQKAIRAQAEQLRAAAKDMARQKTSTQRQADEVRKQIEKARKDAEKARDKARSAKDEAEEERIEQTLESQISALECQIESLDGVCENFDCQIESIEQAIESLNETASEELPEAALAPIPATPATVPAVAVPAAPASPASPASLPSPAAAPCPASAPSPATAPAPAAPPAPLTTAGPVTPPPAAPPAAR